MDRNSVVRWIVIAAAVIVFWKWGLPMVTGKSDHLQSIPEETYVTAPGFERDVIDRTTPEHPAPWKPAEGQVCKLKGNRFDAELSTRGAALTHLYLTDKRYAGSEAFDMSSIPTRDLEGNPTHIERWRSLRTTFRGGDATDQVKYDRFDWKLAPQQADTACTFEYEDDDVLVRKVVSADGRPFELEVTTEITNKANAPKRHQFSIEQYAFRRNEEVKGNLGRVSPFQTDLACAHDKEVVRKNKDDFKEGWFTQPNTDKFAAIDNYYFTQALVPVSDKPECAILAEDWFTGNQPRDDDKAGAVYHARLTSAPRMLAPKETATYKQIALFGPKERDVLAAAAGGHANLGAVINLGFFSPVAKVLVGILDFFHDHVTFQNWGLAIIVMTICLRLILFPLSIKQIKTTIAMRKLKPEIDALNAKFADDAQGKQLATMELWRKHGVNPLGGCLPQLVQMPIWFAMYTTLQTAVEMYHTKFLWFTDLSAPDKFYILPLVLGAFMIVQQRIVPQQGMDPMQQKMMMYLLPGVFTVMMLFLPAALGVYMLTNSILGIGQQLLIERIAPRNGDKKGEIVVKETKPVRGEFGKGKARV